MKKRVIVRYAFVFVLCLSMPLVLQSDHKTLASEAPAPAIKTADSDGDGYTDEQERAWNSDPSNAKSHPDLDSGMAAWWPLDEGSGTQIGDVSGNGHPGAIASSSLPGWTTDQTGTALSFNGGQNRVVVPDSPGLKPTNSLTVVAWIKTAADGVLLGKYSADGQTSSYELSVVGGRLVLALRLKHTEYPLFGHGQVADGAWHHVACVYDGFETRLYVDGERDVLTHLGGQVTATDGPLVIGEIAASMRDVGLYARAFTDGDVKLLYEVVSTPSAALATRQPSAPAFLVARRESRGRDLLARAGAR